MTTCPVCESKFGDCRQLDADQDEASFECDGCGRFDVAFGAHTRLDPHRQRLTPMYRAALSHWLRSRAASDAAPFRITNEWLLNVFLPDARLPTPATQAANLIALIGDSVSKNGEGLFLYFTKYMPSSAPLIGAFDSAMLQNLLKQLLAWRPRAARFRLRPIQCLQGGLRWTGTHKPQPPCPLQPLSFLPPNRHRSTLIVDPIAALSFLGTMLNQLPSVEFLADRERTYEPGRYRIHIDNPMRRSVYLDYVEILEPDPDDVLIWHPDSSGSARHDILRAQETLSSSDKRKQAVFISIPPRGRQTLNLHIKNDPPNAIHFQLHWGAASANRFLPFHRLFPKRIHVDSARLKSIRISAHAPPGSSSP